MWEKKLYIQQNYPDNYVADTFLSEMKKNVDVQMYDYWTLVFNSGIIIQHLSSIMSFIAIFCYVYYEQWSVTNLIILANVLTSIGYISWMAYIKFMGSDFRYEGKQTAKSAILFLMIVLGMSPILKTLTEDTSSDSIWAMTVVCFVMNFAFNDYSGADPSFKVHSTTSSVALNAAIFASVMLASRLSTKTHVFGLMSLAVNWFGLFPLFRRYIQTCTTGWIEVVITVVMVGGTAGIWMPISERMAALYLWVVGMVTFGGPGYFVYLQKYKNEIHGPWDEASLVFSKK